jgi:hypothetical protein
MKNSRLIFSILCMVAFISISMALPVFTDRNLKVLPNNISNEKLDSIMQAYTVALGVNCGFCHVKKNTAGDIDFASDAEPMKENARNMMRMTIDINKKYFYFDKNIQPEYLTVVHCKTCHRGEAIPLEK